MAKLSIKIAYPASSKAQVCSLERHMICCNCDVNIAMVFFVLSYPRLVMVTAQDNYAGCCHEPVAWIDLTNFFQAFFLPDYYKMPGLQVCCGRGNTACFKNHVKLVLLNRFSIIVST